MALNIDGKKTSLNEEADIHQKREDEKSERKKLKEMNGRQKLSYFNTYYLPFLCVVLAIGAVALFLFWADVINKRDVILRCAVINEPVLDASLEEFSDNFILSLKENPEDVTASFYVYYTRSDLAAEIGGNAANDLSEITSRIVAADLGCMIAGQEDGKTYLDHGFFVNLEEFLTPEEYKKLKPYLFHAEAGEKHKAGSYGIYLSKSPVYQELTKELASPVKDPVFSIITNAEDADKEYARKLIYYFFPDCF